ncbi:MAG: outer membrane protein assembly factor BamD [Candidatus Symbiobacter sp.]|nr:outer membrane protein assembly factor BamD [Candidatus Symbiobacter sp.]
MTEKKWNHKMRLGQKHHLAWLGGFFAVALLLSGCSNKDAYLERPVEQLYNEAMDQLSDAKYLGAAKLFDEVDRQHPYSPWATRAEIMAAYARYKATEYDDAISGSERFIQLHPGNKLVAYAYYLKAICYYEQIETVDLDQKLTESAELSLMELIRRFPQSDYAKDAQAKMNLVRDHLAGKEMSIGRWYEKREQYLAAINRFRRVVENYPTTVYTPEALMRLTESYLALGLYDQAKKSAAVLGHNYATTSWYRDSYELMMSYRTQFEGGGDSPMTAAPVTAPPKSPPPKSPPPKSP